MHAQYIAELKLDLLPMLGVGRRWGARFCGSSAMHGSRWSACLGGKGSLTSCSRSASTQGHREIGLHGLPALGLHDLELGDEPPSLAQLLLLSLVTELSSAMGKLGVEGSLLDDDKSSTFPPCSFLSCCWVVSFGLHGRFF
ncbi:hypothetical protein Dimus_008126 [Dionaea muscipula]